MDKRDSPTERPGTDPSLRSRALPGRITGQDVAQRAGVSVATVSLALSGRFQDGHRVAAETRARVRQAAAELGYTPNLVARSLRHGRTGMVAAVIPGFENPYYGEIVAGGQQAALARGYMLTVIEAPDADGRSKALHRLRGGMVDGVVVANHADELLDELDTLRRQGIPTVAVQGRSPEPGIAAVSVDPAEGALAAMRHLLALGHRRIAHLTVIPEDDLGSRVTAGRQTYRLRGYRQALAEAGVPVDPSLLVIDTDRAGDTLLAGVETVRMLLRQARQPPTAIFAYNDLLAIGALRALREEGIRVPDDMALVGHDGISLGDYTTPSLTTVDHQCRAQGLLAVQLLCDELEGVESGGTERVLPARLRVRESSGGSIAT